MPIQPWVQSRAQNYAMTDLETKIKWDLDLHLHPSSLWHFIYAQDFLVGKPEIISIKKFIL